MSEIIETTIKDILANPEKFAGKKIMVRARITFLGKTPRGPTYSINLPEEEEFDVALLKCDGEEVLCYGLEDLPFEEYNNKEVIVIGRVVIKGGSVGIKVQDIKLVEEGEKSEEKCKQ
ncbi:MAG: hypothetical protein ACTSX9_05550 [Candidatus Njordarchaeales archaeon]